MSLAGRTVLVTRPAHQAGALAEAIRAAGGEAWIFPAIEIEAVPVDAVRAVLDDVPAPDLTVFISPNAARFGMKALRAAGRAADLGTVFAVGPGTARALRDEGVENVIVPTGHDSEALLAQPQLQAVDDQRAFIVRGVGGRPLLGDTLRARGADVHYVECYRRVRPDTDATALTERWRAGGIDAVTVTSAETLRNLAEMMGEVARPLLVDTPLFVPHAKIGEAAHRFGITDVVITAGGDAGLVDGLVNWFRNTR